MKEMKIYEPAMCCPTGLCGVGVDHELIRISSILNTLKKNGVTIERFNLTDSPQEFMKNKTINDLLNENGDEKLPVAVVDGEIAVEGRYPTNEEIANLLDIPMDLLGKQVKD